MEHIINKSINCIGLFCPMPLIKTKRALKEIDIGNILELKVTDNHVVRDLATWSKQSGQKILLFEEDNVGVSRFLIKKQC